jgi:hypothetical protein
MVLCAVLLFLIHAYYQSVIVTLGAGATFIVFAITVLRVDWGVYILVVCTLLSPEVDAGAIGMGNRSLNIRIEDFLIIVVFLGVLVRNVWEGQPTFWRPSPINSGIIVYLTICIASTAVAWHRGLPLFRANRTAALFVLLKMVEFYMVFILVGSAIRNRTQMRKQIVVFLTVALIVSVYAIYSRFSALERVSAPFEKGGTEPNTLGGYLVLVMCICAGLFTQAPSRRMKACLLGITIITFFPFLFTLSRASYIAFVAALVVLSLVGRKWSLLAIMVGVLALSEFIMPPDVKQRVNYTFQEGAGERVYVAGRDTGLQVDKSTYERIYVWQKVRYNLSVWPWLGGGVEWGRILDSQYARVLIETGLLGFAAFMFLQWRLLLTTRQAYLWTDDWFARGLSMGAFTATVALVVHSMGTISFLIVRIMEPYWFLIALATVTRSIALEEYLARRAAEKAQTTPEVQAQDPPPSGIPAPAPARCPG